MKKFSKNLCFSITMCSFTYEHYCLENISLLCDCESEYKLETDDEESNLDKGSSEETESANVEESADDEPQIKSPKNGSLPNLKSKLSG